MYHNSVLFPIYSALSAFLLPEMTPTWESAMDDDIFRPFDSDCPLAMPAF